MSLLGFSRERPLHGRTPSKALAREGGDNKEVHRGPLEIKVYFRSEVHHMAIKCRASKNVTTSGTCLSITRILIKYSSKALPLTQY